MMSIVVLTAAFSNLNAGLYSTGRTLRSLAMYGSAPSFTAKMSRHGVPYIGILFTGMVATCGVGLNALLPTQAFEIVLNMSSLGTITAWAAIVLCQLRLWHRWRSGVAQRPAFRLAASPWTGLATLVFLVIIVGLMANSEDDVQRWAIRSTLVVVIPALVAGWYLRQRRAAQQPDKR